MQKAVTHIRAVLGRIIFIGLSVQVVFGLLWMCCSFTGVQWFAESTFYVKVSENLLCDEYTGILYPFLLMLVGENNIWLCLLQVAAALLAGFCLLGAVGVKKSCWRIWGSLVLLTYPFAMQCHMAVLPNSFAFSCFLAQLALVLLAIQKKHGSWLVELFGVHVLWLGAALFMPEYLYLGAVPVILFWLYDAVKYCKQAGWRVCCHLLLVAATAGMILSVNELSQQEGAYGRNTPSLEAVLFERITWSSLEKYYFDWPAEVQDTFHANDFLLAAENVENMDVRLLPRIEEGLGLEAARAFYRDMSAYVLKNNYYQIFYEIGWDALGSVVPTVAAESILNGSGYRSYFIRNYETLRQDCPTLTKYYFNYVIWWFKSGMLLTAVMTLLGLLGGKKHRTFAGKGSLVYCLAICMISAGVMAVWYTVNCTGSWDYKDGLFTGILWFVWMILMAVKGVEEEL